LGKRLFFAVDIDDATREQIACISADLRAAIETYGRASWVRPDRMHLTLHFFGSADAIVEQRARAALASPIQESPFDVMFDGVGFFPERGSPRVLWLGLRDGLEPLRRVHKTVVGPLAGVDAFRPHLTLARLRDRVPRAKFAQIAGIPASAGPSRIDRVTLYESRLSPAGPTYVPLAAATLKP
jgi:2'-5' RNA ligase